MPRCHLPQATTRSAAGSEGRRRSVHGSDLRTLSASEADNHVHAQSTDVLLLQPRSDASAAFRFDESTHKYCDLITGEVFPHITGMLNVTGWIDDRWFSEESCDRGKAVHKLTADYDLGALTNVETCVSRYKGWLLGHVAAMRAIRPVWLGVEEPIAHPKHRFGGRPDRVGTIYALAGVLEVKSGPPARGHQIQTALQAILVSGRLRLPDAAVARFALYLTKNGKWKLEQHKERRDFDEAYRIIRVCCVDIPEMQRRAVA